jgi:predicted transcriptional regulator
MEEECMLAASIKEEARQLVDRLPDDATWEDLQYQIYFRQAVDAGLKDSEEGRVVPLEEVRRRFGLGTS